MLKRIMLTLILGTMLFLLTACNSNSNIRLSINNDVIYATDMKSVYKINITTGQINELLKDEGHYYTNIAFRSGEKSLITPVDEAGGKLRLYEINQKGLSKLDLDKVRPHNIYNYKNYIVMDNDQIFKDKQNVFMGEWVIFDTNRQEFIKRDRIYGIFRSITGYRHFAYITSYSKEKGSNIYEVNLKTLETRKIFNKNVERAPSVIFSETGKAYGFYNHWQHGESNSLVEINLKTGDQKKIAQLPEFSYDVLIKDNKAIIIHYDQNNGVENIKEPLTIVDLQSKEKQRLSVNGWRPTDVISHNEKIIISNERGFIVVLDLSELKIDKYIKTNKSIYYMTNAK